MKIEHIAVLCGGPSGEHEVSLKSGSSVADALREHFPRVDRIVLDGRDFTLPLGVQCVFNVIHGEFGEDGTLQAELERLGVPYVGSGPAASRLAMHKVESKRVLAEAGVPVLPDWVLGRDASIPADLAVPFVVKPAAGGSSIGVTIVRDPGKIAAALDVAFELGLEVLIEPYMSAREFTVAVWGERALPVVEVRPKAEFYDIGSSIRPVAQSIWCLRRYPRRYRVDSKRSGIGPTGRSDVGIYRGWICSGTRQRTGRSCWR